MFKYVYKTTFKHLNGALMRKFIIINHGFWSTQEIHCFQSIPMILDKSKETAFDDIYEKSSNANKLIYSCDRSLDHGPLYCIGSLGSDCEIEFSIQDVY